MLQVAVEQEVSEYLGRGHYQRGARRIPGYRNGYERAGVATEAGRLEVKVPQVRDCEAFHSAVLTQFTNGTPALKRLVLSMYVRGLSVRDIEASFEEAFGARVLSKSAVSEVTQTIGEQFAQWQARDLSELRVAYLFLDGHYLRLREGTDEKAGVLCAYGLLETGQKVLLTLMLGEKESEEAWLSCLRDLVERGIKAPLLIISDGAPGLKAAVRKVFPKALAQRCQVHKMRNILCKLPKDVQKVMTKKVRRIFTATPDFATAVRWGKELIAEYRDDYPSAMECLEKELEVCLTCLKFPKLHAKRIRTTNLIERTFGETRRRTKVIPFFFKEQSGLNLVFATLITIAKKWRGVKVTPAIQLELMKIREQLYHPSPTPIAIEEVDLKKAA
jgi:transposase-like protein